MKQHFASNLGLLILRIPLGLYLLIAGVGKVRGELAKGNGIGTFYKENFTQMQPDWLPQWFGLPYGYALPWLEVIVGGLLILGLLGRFAAIAGALMLISFTTVIVISSGSITGQGPDAVGSFHANYVHTAGWLALALALIGCGRWTVDSLIFGKRKGGG